jgi:hypothetical protein
LSTDYILHETHSGRQFERLPWSLAKKYRQKQASATLYKRHSRCNTDENIFKGVSFSEMDDAAWVASVSLKLSAVLKSWDINAILYSVRHRYIPVD